MPELPNLVALAEAASASVVDPPMPRFEAISELPLHCPAVPSLPAELLPPTLRPWIEDISDRMQVPLDFTAVPAVAGLAAVVGRRLGIRPKANDDWLVIPNLWGAIISRPGMLKSPALAEALRPIRRLAAKAQKEHKQLILSVGVKLESLHTHEAAIKGFLRRAHEGKHQHGTTAELEESLRVVAEQIEELETSAVERRYIVNDTTTEKLGEIMAANPRGLLLERDELAGWLRSLERDDRKSDREFFLEAWNGANPYTYDRIGRGTIHISALCLSLIGGIQPAKLARFVSDALDGGFAADGLLQRIQLAVWPEDRGDWRLIDRAPHLTARETVHDLFTALDNHDLRSSSCEDGEVPALRFSPDAQELFYAWLTELETRLRSEEIKAHPAFESHLSKYRSLMPSLALLFHLVESVGRGEIPPVSLAAAKLAGDWCEFLEQHARKVYAPEIGTDAVAAHALAAKIRKGEIFDGMTVREVYRANWSGLKVPEVAFAGLTLLQRHGWLAVVVPNRSGRPSQVIRLNPARAEGR